MRIFNLNAIVLMLGLIAVIGCSSAPEATREGSRASNATMAAVNTTCPIMGGRVTDKGGRTEWNGQTIGFCCPDCISPWNELSEEEKTSKLAETSESSGTHNHLDHADHGSAEN